MASAQGVARWRSRPSVRAARTARRFSADLTGSNLTNTLDARSSKRRSRDADARRGNYINYGVREFGMAAIMNGLALHGGFIPYGGTFLTFSRLRAQCHAHGGADEARAIHVFTHDSIGLGEDGPTHQSVEHMASLRLIPKNRRLAPCDTVETLVAWTAAIERRDGPSVPDAFAPEPAVRISSSLRRARGSWR